MTAYMTGKELHGRVIPSRSTDPKPSHLGAEDVKLRAGSQKHRLLKVHVEAGRALTNEESAELAGITHPRACPWKRNSELTEMGLLAWTEDFGKSSADSVVGKHVATYAGIKKLRELNEGQH